MRDDDELERLLTPLPSGRHGLSREQVVRSQRTRLLHAAIAVAGGEGYAAMTVSAVLARANVSRKTFYEQFADREDCFLAAYELVAERALAGVRAAYAVEAPWVDRLRHALAGALCELLGARIRHGRVAELPRLLPDLLFCALAPFVGPVAAAEALAGDRPPRRRRGRAHV